MRINYKSIDSKLSLDEYNGLVYMLRQQTWDEVIRLSKEKVKGKYGTYTLYDPDKILVETGYGWKVKDTSKKAYIQVESEFTGNFYAQLFINQVKNGTKLTKPFEYFESEKEQTTKERIKAKNDFLNNNRYTFEKTTQKDSETKILNAPKNSTPHISAKSKNNDGKLLIELNIPNEYINYTIAFDCIMQLIYDDPEIDVTSGEPPLDNEIICETFEEMKLAIDTTPWGGTINIKLLGETYDFKDEIKIENKTVTINGGGHNNIGDSYTVLDAHHICRHFNILQSSNVIIRNCKFINGYAMGNKSRSDLHYRGGSIFLSSAYKPFGGNYLHLKTSLLCENCQFVKNSADRGGAIYNKFARLELNNCVFDDNDCQYEQGHNVSNYKSNQREWRKWNWGGAIRSESVEGYYYHERFDKLHIMPSPIRQSAVENNDIVNLVFSELQNTKILMEKTILGYKTHEGLINKEKPNPNATDILRVEYFDYFRKTACPVTKVARLEKTEKGLYNYDIQIQNEFHLGDRGYFKFTLVDQGINDSYEITTTPIVVLGELDPTTANGVKSLVFRTWNGESVILATTDSIIINHYADNLCDFKFNLAHTNNAAFMEEINRNMNVNNFECYDLTAKEDIVINSIGERKEVANSTDNKYVLPKYYFPVQLASVLKEGHSYQFRLRCQIRDVNQPNWYKFDERITRTYHVEKKENDLILKVAGGN